jgi:nickel-dependent lactate racemase
MAVVFARGGEDAVIDEAAQREAVRTAVELAGDTDRPLMIPPDGSRAHSGAGALTRMLREESAGPARTMPALGTHRGMNADEIRAMFGQDAPLETFLEHRWRDDLVRLGTVPSDFVHSVSEGVLRGVIPDYDIPVEINRALVEGGYSAIFSVGQVVPHEVIGMANGIKNILVGTGGQETINKSHFLGAAYGMERMMGRADTPVRAVMDYAHEHYLQGLGIIYLMTVMQRDATSGELLTRGLYVGDDGEAFRMAADLSRRVNVTLLDEPQDRIVAWIDPLEYKSTWLGNKAIYRTRMAMADDGELTVLAPGVETFGEDPEIDRLVRRYGYHGTPATLASVRENPELRANLSAAAHLIHGSSEGRFRIVYATDPALLSRSEVEGAGFEWRDVRDAISEFGVDAIRGGQHERFYYVPEPALGLWAAKARYTGAST